MTDDGSGRRPADDPAGWSADDTDRAPTGAPDGRSRDGPTRPTDDGTGRRQAGASRIGFTGAFREVLTDPDRFYARDPSLPGATAVVALSIAFLLVYMRVFVTWVGTNFPDRVVSEVWGQLFFAVLLGGLIGWFLIAGLAHGVSALFGGSGLFERTLANVGWGFAPQVVAAPFQFALVLAFTSDAEPPPTDTELAAMEQLLVGDPMLQVATLVGLAGTVWSVYLWYHGLRHARDLGSDGALASVALPALWMVYDQLSPFLAG